MIDRIMAFFKILAAKRCARRGWHDWSITVHQYDEEKSIDEERGIKDQELTVVAVYRTCNDCGERQSTPAGSEFIN